MYSVTEESANAIYLACRPHKYNLSPFFARPAQMGDRTRSLV